MVIRQGSICFLRTTISFKGVSAQQVLVWEFVGLMPLSLLSIVIAVAVPVLDRFGRARRLVAGHHLNFIRDDVPTGG